MGIKILILLLTTLNYVNTINGCYSKYMQRPSINNIDSTVLDSMNNYIISDTCDYIRVDPSSVRCHKIKDSTTLTKITETFSGTGTVDVTYSCSGSTLTIDGSVLSLTGLNCFKPTYINSTTSSTLFCYDTSNKVLRIIERNLCPGMNDGYTPIDTCKCQSSCLKIKSSNNIQFMTSDNINPTPTSGGSCPCGGIYPSCSSCSCTCGGVYPNCKSCGSCLSEVPKDCVIESTHNPQIGKCIQTSKGWLNGTRHSIYNGSSYIQLMDLENNDEVFTGDFYERVSVHSCLLEQVYSFRCLRGYSSTSSGIIVSDRGEVTWYQSYPVIPLLNNFGLSVISLISDIKSQLFKFIDSEFN